MRWFWFLHRKRGGGGGTFCFLAVIGRRLAPAGVGECACASDLPEVRFALAI